MWFREGDEFLPEPQVAHRSRLGLSTAGSPSFDLTFFS